MTSGFVRRHAFLIFYAIAWAIPLALTVMLYWWQAPLVWLNGRPFNPDTVITDALQHSGYSRVNVIALVPMMLFAPATCVILFYAGAPSIAALIVSSAGWGRRGLLDLLSRFNPVRKGRGAFSAYAIMLTGILSVIGFGLFLSAVDGRGVPAALKEMSQTYAFGLGGWLIFSLFLNEGGTLEELGWRGFAQPLLTDRLNSPLGAAILLGTLWSAWHLPLRLTSPYVMHASIHWSVFLGALLIDEIGTAILCGYFVNRTGGSVWPAIMIHAFTNNMNATFSAHPGHPVPGVNVIDDGFVFRIGVIAIAALIVVIAAGPRLGLPRGARAWSDNEYSRA